MPVQAGHSLSFVLDRPSHSKTRRLVRGCGADAGPRGRRASLLRDILVYRTGEHGLGRDPYARFAAPPGWLLTAAIRGYLTNADFVRDVVAPGGDSRSQATVEVDVSNLAGDLRPGGSSAVLTMRFRVFPDPDAHGPPEILLKTYSKSIPIPRSTAKDVVDGWNQGLAEIMAEFQADLRGSLAETGLLSSVGFAEVHPVTR